MSKVEIALYGITLLNLLKNMYIYVGQAILEFDYIYIKAVKLIWCLELVLWRTIEPIDFNKVSLTLILWIISNSVLEDMIENGGIDIWIPKLDMLRVMKL